MDSITKKHLFCFGYGYTAEVLAGRLRQQGWRITGTTRSVEKANTLQRQNIMPIVWQGDEPLPHSAFDGVTHVLHSIRPTSKNHVVLQYCGDALANTPTLQWVGYLSTTGVYGDHDGDWVDESTPVQPANQRSEYRVQAELSWLSWGDVHDKTVQVFRLGGIYGKGRSVLERLQAGKGRRLDIPNQYFSRIHVEDIANVLQAAITKPQAGAIYNVVDNLPESGSVVTEYAANLLGIEPPPLQTLEEADLSQMARSFYESSRRVRNDKIKHELGVTLAYPTYKEGLRQILSQKDD